MKRYLIGSLSALLIAVAFSAHAQSLVAERQITPVPAQEAALGLEQSPIDIIAEQAVREDLPELNFKYGTGVTLNVVNTGSPGEEASVRADVPPGGGTLEIGDTVYDLLQLHFHAPGEHELNGKGFPMEMHLVHQRAGTEETLVVGVWIVEGEEPHPELDRIFADLPLETETRTIESFDLTTLFPEDFKSFRYAGSLTTPPFTEGVQWVVLERPLGVSSEQISAFQALFPAGNAREVQPLNDRTVVTDAQTGGEEPPGQSSGPRKTF